VIGTFNIGSGTPIRVGALAEEFGKSRDVKVFYEHPREGEIEYVALNVTRARDAHLL
jgi:hypothetical protein